VSRADVELVMALSSVFAADVVELLADEPRVRQIMELAAPAMHPDAEISFVGAEGVGLLANDFRGMPGLIAGWREWTSSWSSYRVEAETAFESRGRVVLLARQTGRTIHGDVEVPSAPSAAIFTIADGRITRAAFYLDRQQAAADEGFELPDG
jgi:ketosteroid isomerase-like protein